MMLEGAFSPFPILTTDRLRLRQMLMSDAESLYEIKSDAKVTGRYGQEPHDSIEETREWICRSLAHYERREAISWAITIKDEDAAIGMGCFWNLDPGSQRAEIGYELHPSYWRRGIMAEALSAILTYGFLDLGLHRIEACPLADNQPSRDLLLKLGFSYEGTLRQRLSFQDRFEDQMFFGLLKEEWVSRGTDL
jgi:ribosomal-protein-alanine N-acetyltransferase